MSSTSILSLTVEDMMIQLLRAGSDASSFVARREDGSIALTVGIAIEDKAAPFASLIDGFLEDPVTIAKDMDDVKGDTAALVGES